MTRLIRQLLRRKPFQPFRIVMRSGERHEIGDPERMAIGESYLYWFPPSGLFVRLAKKEIELVYEPRRARR